MTSEVRFLVGTGLRNIGALRPIERVLQILLLCAAIALAGCASPAGAGYHNVDVTPGNLASGSRILALSSTVQARILALNPEKVTQTDISEVLAQVPAPRIINIHGGILPLHANMNSFSEFLIGMGYPESSIRHPNDGAYTFGYYDNSDMIAGVIAWYYENDGLRPMMVGFSQGGFQAMRVLHRMAGGSGNQIAVWNPLTNAREERYDISDPLTGKTRPVVGVQASYACVAVAGGLGRFLPNQWSMNSKLRKVPDSVEEFTGFHKGLDLLGGDYLGYGSANDYVASGSAIVRNVQLPSSYGHASIPDTRHLLKSQAIKDWINNYQPANAPMDTPKLDVKFDADSDHILWAAEVWYSIKKHWVLELQRKIRAQSAASHAS